MRFSSWIGRAVESWRARKPLERVGGCQNLAFSLKQTSLRPYHPLSWSGEGVPQGASHQKVSPSIRGELASRVVAPKFMGFKQLGLWKNLGAKAINKHYMYIYIHIYIYRYIYITLDIGRGGVCSEGVGTKKAQKER